MSRTELFVGTTVLNTMFFLAGIDKALHFQKVVDGFEKRLSFAHLPNCVCRLAILIAIMIELIAPIIILYASFEKNIITERYAVYACYILMIFTILATLIYHFPPINSVKYYPFMSNLTTIGGLYLGSLHFKN